MESAARRARQEVSVVRPLAALEPVARPDVGVVAVGNAQGELFAVEGKVLDRVVPVGDGCDHNRVAGAQRRGDDAVALHAQLHLASGA